MNIRKVLLVMALFIFTYPRFAISSQPTPCSTEQEKVDQCISSTTCKQNIQIPPGCEGDQKKRDGRCREYLIQINECGKTKCKYLEDALEYCWRHPK
jgi:hypothetical protein